MEQTYSKKCKYFVVLIVCVAGMVIFDRSLVFVSSQMSTLKLISLAVNVLMIGIVPVLFAFVPLFAGFTDRMLDKIEKMVSNLWQHRKQIAKCLVYILCAWCAAWLTENGILCNILNEPENVSRRVFIFAIFLLGYTIYAFRNCAGEKPEVFFAVTTLILGTMLIHISPATLGVMVDDETHYARVLAEANLFDGSCLDAEEKTLNDFMESVYNKLAYDRESRAQYYAELNAMYEQKTVVRPSVRLHGIWSLAYVPMAIGMIIGQGLSLSFISVFMLSKFFNLLCYVALFYFAIKKIPQGKVLMATIGMIPTCIFMASNYTYDPWLIGFIALAYAYYFYEIQNPEKILEVKNVICMLVFLLLGCMPKAVYCVLGIPFLFMPKKKFRDKKQRLLYYLPVLLAGLALAATFLVPALIQGVGEGDLRGGEGINANVQLAYIISHPVAYMKVLVNFLKNYFSVQTAQTYLQMYFYFGKGEFVKITIAILIIVAFTDKRGGKNMTIPVRISLVIAALLAAVACATVMYIVYTPVASSQIFGCQGRYLLPAIFPFLMGVTPEWNKNHFHPHVYTIVPIMLLAATFLYNVYTMCVALY